MDVELAEIRDFLARHAPYGALPAHELDRLPGRLEVRYARRGTTLVRLGERNDVMFVLRSGAVDIRDAEGALVERAEAGTSFAMSALLEGGPSAYEFVAIEDSLLLAVPAAVLADLCRHPEVRTWYDRRHHERLRRAAGLDVAERTGLRSAALDLVRRPPVTGPVTLTVREAAERMRDASVSSLLLVADDGRLVGIVTDRDLRNRVLAPGLDPGTPVHAVMTPDPVHVSPGTPAFEVLMEMVTRAVHHLPVVDRGRAVGMVTSTDLMRLERADPVHLVADLRRAEDLDAVRALAARLPLVVQRLVDDGGRAADVARVVTAVGDAVEHRLLDLAVERLGPAPAPWCWVVLGSRARHEQVLGADQDHALVVADEARPEDEAWFAALAAEVADGLAACGYAPCPGGVMARERPWRRTVRQWRAAARAWTSRPEPHAVLTGAIAFDMRPLHGDADLGSRVHAELVDAAASTELFLAYLTRHALSTSPPLGFFRSFVLEPHGGHTDTLDLKRRGLAPVVDLARVHAVAAGSTRVNTATRLRVAAATGRLGDEAATELVEAYEVVARVRLEHHVRLLRAGQPVDHHVRPAELGVLERRHLRDAFGVVKQAQAALARGRLVPYL